MSLTHEQDKTITIYEPGAIMTTYKDLKSVKYIDATINFAERLLGIDFKRTGSNRYSSYCPFHFDRKDSLRVYVDGKDEIRFKCFGACQGESDDEKANWDIYDLIMVRNKCSFREVQIAFSKYMGIEDFIPYSGTAEHRPTPTEIAEPDEPVNFAEQEELDPKITQVLGEASIFYNEMLINNEDRFNKVHKYLHRRGVDTGCELKKSKKREDKIYIGGMLNVIKLTVC